MPRGRAFSFRTRLTIRWTVLFSGVLAIGSAVIFLGLRSMTYENLDAQLRTLAGTEVASAVDGPGTVPHVHEMPEPVLLDGTFTRKLVQVFDPQGRLVVASAGAATDVPLIDQPLIRAALSGGMPVQSVDVDREPLRVIALRAVANGSPYAMAVGVEISDVEASLRRVAVLLALVWMVSTLATAAAGFTLASTVLTPVTAITKRAMDIASNDLRARLESPVVQDEIGEMTLSLNALLERLQAAIDANRRFAADAAHELRTPITAMAGEIEVALRRERTAAEYKETLDAVGQSVGTLSALIGDLMLLARTQETGRTLERQAVSLEWLLKTSVAKLASMAASRGVVIDMDGLADLCVDGDPRLLARVFDNVIENAIRYNRQSGRVVVSASGDESAQMVTVRVRDEGQGIPDRARERIFERFYRVDESRSPHTGGSGLGLAIAREVLTLFGGTVNVEQSSNQGTTIAMTLPGRRSAHG